MDINRRDLILTAIGVGLILIIGLGITFITLWGAAGALSF